MIPIVLVLVLGMAVAWWAGSLLWAVTTPVKDPETGAPHYVFRRVLLAWGLALAAYAAFFALVFIGAMLDSSSAFPWGSLRIVLPAWIVIAAVLGGGARAVLAQGPASELHRWLLRSCWLAFLFSLLFCGGLLLWFLMTFVP
jgi:hypothetical protein